VRSDPFAEQEYRSLYRRVGSHLRASQVESFPDQADDRKDEEAGDDHLVRTAIGRAQLGEMDAIRFLYTCYAADVLACVRSLVRDHQEAEDITQEVFIKLIDVVDQYTPRGAIPFGAWIRRVARNCAYDHLRSRRSIPCEELYLQSDHGHAELERRRDICEALDSLPKEQRDVIVMRHILGLSPPEIAVILGKTESSIHGLHHRGRLNLRGSLTKLGVTPVVAPSRRPSHLRALPAAPPPESQPETDAPQPRDTSLRA
jgi:RNA polymerase sigma-70 factor, ECF subfamily